MGERRRLALIVAVAAVAAVVWRLDADVPSQPQRLQAPADNAVCCQGERAYASTNGDGRAGAGPRAVAYHAGGVAVRHAAAVPHFFRTGFGGWEPTLGLGRNGEIFYAARNSNVDPTPLRSRDGGRTWEAILPADGTGRRTHDLSLDPYIWVDPATGRVFTSDLGEPLGCPPLSHSDDAGDSWFTTRICGPVDHQTLFGGPPPQGAPRNDGYPNVVYYCTNDPDHTGCQRSRDGGRTWALTEGRPFDGSDADECGWATGHGVVDDRGTIYLPKGSCGIPRLAVSHDEGATWKRVAISVQRMGQDTVNGSKSYAHDGAVAVDSHGTIYYLWIAEDGHPRLALSRDGGALWSAPLDLLPPGVLRASLPAIDVGEPGRIAVAFMGSPDADSPEDADATWNGYVVGAPDVLAADPLLYATSVNDPQTNVLWKGPCGNQRCGNVGDFIDVEVDAEGSAWSAWVDSCPGMDQCTSFGVSNPRGEAVLAALRFPAATAAPAPVRCSPSIALRQHRNRVLRGTVRCATGVVRVEVALARVAGKRCRFATARGRLRAAGPCVPRAYLRARGASRWSLTLPRALPVGRYRVWVRTIGAGGAAAPPQPTRVVRIGR